MKSVKEINKFLKEIGIPEISPSEVKTQKEKLKQYEPFINYPEIFRTRVEDFSRFLKELGRDPTKYLKYVLKRETESLKNGRKTQLNYFYTFDDVLKLLDDEEERKEVLKRTFEAYDNATFRTQVALRMNPENKEEKYLMEKQKRENLKSIILGKSPDSLLDFYTESLLEKLKDKESLKVLASHFLDRTRDGVECYRYYNKAIEVAEKAYKLKKDLNTLLFLQRVIKEEVHARLLRSFFQAKDTILVDKGHFSVYGKSSKDLEDEIENLIGELNMEPSKIYIDEWTGNGLFSARDRLNITYKLEEDEDEIPLFVRGIIYQLIPEEKDERLIVGTFDPYLHVFYDALGNKLVVEEKLTEIYFLGRKKVPDEALKYEVSKEIENKTTRIKNIFKERIKKKNDEEFFKKIVEEEVYKSFMESIKEA